MKKERKEKKRETRFYFFSESSDFAQCLGGLCEAVLFSQDTSRFGTHEIFNVVLTFQKRFIQEESNM